jgi:tetratricopeptide (TPR) repeat protein
VNINSLALLLACFTAPDPSCGPFEDEKQAGASAGQNSGSPENEGKKLFDRANTHLQKGEFAEAEQIFTKILSEHKDVQEISLVHYPLGICRQMQGKKEEAKESFKVFLDKNDSAIEITDARLITDNPTHDVLDARARLEALVVPKLTSSQRELLLEADASLRYGEGIVRDAMAYSDRFESDPESAADKARIREKEAKLREGHYMLRKSLALLENLKADIPEFLPIYSRLGRAYEGLNLKHKAYVTYNFYIKSWTNNRLSPLDMTEIRQHRLSCEMEYSRRDLILQAAYAQLVGDFDQALASLQRVDTQGEGAPHTLVETQKANLQRARATRDEAGTQELWHASYPFEGKTFRIMKHIGVDFGLALVDNTGNRYEAILTFENENALYDDEGRTPPTFQLQIYEPFGGYPPGALARGGYPPGALARKSEMGQATGTWRGMGDFIYWKLGMGYPVTWSRRSR